MHIKKIALLPVIALAFTPFATRADFPDVSQNSEYYQSISALQELGIVQGYGNGEFNQERQVSRAEFLKMAFLSDAKSKKHTNKDASTVFPGVDAVKVNLNCFPDVNETDWFAPYVCWAKENGIISGFPDGKFYPHQTVNVAEGAKILAKEEGSYIKGHWANSYFARLAPYTFPSSIIEADQLLNRADTVEMVWRYHFATENQLKAKSSKLLVWDGEQFLNLNYLGSVTNGELAYYGKYNDQIYFVSQDGYPPQVVSDANPNTFRVQSVSFHKNDWDLEFGIPVDDRAIYQGLATFPESTGGTISIFDGYSFSSQDGMVSSFYLKDQKYIYIYSCYEGCAITSMIPNSDAASFEPLEEGYAKDKNYVYLRGKPLEGVDPATFEIIDFNADTTALCKSPFSKDRDHVYLLNKILPEVDSASFEMVQDYGFFFKDKNNIYKTIHEAKGSACTPTNAVRIENIDIATFKPLGSNYFLSQNKIYFINGGGSVILTTANPETFVPYLIPKEIKDPEKEYEFAPFGKDDQYVYYNGKPLEEIDVATFYHLEPNILDGQIYAWADKNRSYSWKDFSEMIGMYK